MMALDVATTPLREISSHFQRSINLTYDAGNADYVAGYIPTPNGAEALATIFDGTMPASRQRAYVLHAAYGSGKSLLGLVLSAFASHDPNCQDAISIVQERLKRIAPEQAKCIDHYLDRGVRLLPVVLTGNEGNLGIALTRALSRALIQHNISSLRLDTQFQAALDAISLWEISYPSAYQQLQECLTEKNTSLSQLLEGLHRFDSNTLKLFEQIYPQITAGSHFELNTSAPLDNIFYTAAKALHGFGYAGIIIVWDEFGRFLESTVGDAFGSEAALLQSFAEFCNRSGSYQVHLVLITHRLISGYAAGLPLSHQQEWARIAERFRAHDVSCDSSFSYRLIAEALTIPETAAWHEFAEKYRFRFDQLTAFSLELSLFEELDDVVLRQQIIERVWPLHPLSVYALPRLSSRVAQNERTLFTFLAAYEPGTLIEHLMNRQNTNEWWLIGLDVIWDYFSEAIRADVKSGGTHSIWSGAMYAFSKIDANDDLACALVKTLAILLIVGEINIQSRAAVGQVVPTTELLTWALEATKGEITTHLETLAQRRAVIHRRADGYWTFTRGSDIDLDAELQVLRDRFAPTQQQMRQILERDFPPPFHLPRGYNQERCITRFFKGLYRWPNEIKNTCDEEFLKQLGGSGYADGAIIYILATNAAEREEAIKTVQTLPGGRVVYIIPDQPLLIMEPIRDLFALYDLSNNPGFLQKDERLAGEITFFIEDAQRRLMRALSPLLESDLSKATWWWYENERWYSRQQTVESISRLLSRLCYGWFSETPILNNELVNQYAPSGQQERAMEKVIDALLKYPHDMLPPDLHLAGHGPDWLIARTLLFNTKLIHPTAVGYYVLKEPAGDTSLTHLWGIVQGFLNNATENECEISSLLDKLQSPPFGLRKGVLPVLLAAMLRPRLSVLTLRQNKRVISPITGQIFINLCKHPEEYTIELIPWDVRRASLWSVLKDRIGSYLTDQEKAEQPFNALSVGLLRWLQSQPRYCRDTISLSLEAQRFRNLLRKAQREPAQVLAYELLELLDDGSVDITSDGDAYRQMLIQHLLRLMDEVATAYQKLLYSLDRFTKETFAADASDGHTALRSWLATVEKQVGKSLGSFRFSDKLAERLVQVICQDDPIPDGLFWDQISKAILGIALNDWNDRSSETFRQKLLEAKERVEHEVFELASGESSVKLSVSLPTKDEQTYRFRSSNLSLQGQRILQNFKSTLEIAGRPLSPDEKRQIALALLEYVMGGSNFDD
jgi:hypothetical protein